MPGFPVSPGVCSNLCPLSHWYHPTFSSCVTPFSSCLQSFPVLPSFPMSWLFASGSLSIAASASSFRWIFRVDFLYDWLVWSSCCPRDSQESSPALLFVYFSPFFYILKMYIKCFLIFFNWLMRLQIRPYWIHPRCFSILEFCTFFSNCVFYSLTLTILTKGGNGFNFYRFLSSFCPLVMATLIETHGNDLPGVLQFYGQLFMAYSLSVLFPLISSFLHFSCEMTMARSWRGKCVTLY